MKILGVLAVLALGVIIGSMLGALVGKWLAGAILVVVLVFALINLTPKKEE
jgi:uncharacterized membrane protein YfcA